MDTQIVNKNTWFVYLLRCSDDTLYTGITNELPRRIAQHGKGTAARYTRGRLPVVLVYSECADNRSCALRREAEIKKFSREEKLALILQRTVCELPLQY